MAKVTGGIIGANVALTHVDASPQHALGERVTGDDGTVWLYVHASGAITRYDTVAIDENYEAAAITTALARAGHQIGFAQVAFADNEWGWVAVSGSNIRARFADECQPDVLLYTSGTAGVLDDTYTGFARIRGVVAVATETAGTGDEEIIAGWPEVDIAMTGA